MLRYLMKIAKDRGIRKFEAKVLPANKAMLAVFYNSGYSVKTVFDGDAYSVTMSLVEEEK